ncbi:MAG: SPOR domain-containing protein [Desulfobacterales bacterium]|nr:SPOR domain-containing protein [Desulfobacterales bacterium]
MILVILLLGGIYLYFSIFPKYASSKKSELNKDKVKSENVFKIDESELNTNASNTDSKISLTSPIVSLIETQLEKKTKPDSPSETSKPVHQDLPVINLEELTDDFRFPYTIHVKSLQESNKAVEFAQKLKAQGYNSVFTSLAIIPSKGGEWHRVFIGYYETLDDAKLSASLMKKNGFDYANPMKTPFTIQLGVAHKDYPLNTIIDNISAKGYLPYTMSYGNKEAVKLIIGAFEDKNKAEVLLKRLEADGFKAEITLR